MAMIDLKGLDCQEMKSGRWRAQLKAIRSDPGPAFLPTNLLLLKSPPVIHPQNGATFTLGEDWPSREEPDLGSPGWTRGGKGCPPSSRDSTRVSVD